MTLCSGSRGTVLESLLPKYEAAFASVVAGEYVQISASFGRRIAASRSSVPFPNGAVMHIIAWHELESAHRPPPRADTDVDLLGTEFIPRTAPRAANAAASEAAVPVGAAVHAEEDADDGDALMAHAAARSEHSSGKVSKSIATIFRKALADGGAEALPLRRLRVVTLFAVFFIAVAAIALMSVASSNLTAVVASTKLVWSGASRCAFGLQPAAAAVP